jgi:hypothetical protein
MSWDEVMDLLEAIFKWFLTGCTLIGMLTAIVLAGYFWG